MIFPTKSDYPNNFAILDYQHPTQTRLHTSLVEASASAYFESDPMSRYFLTRKFRHTASLFHDRSFDRVLDAGTGIGYFVPHLASIAKEVVGVERNEAAMYAREMLKKRGIANASVEQYDLLSLPYKDSSFDCVVALSVLDAFNGHELKIVLNNFRRVLAPHGLLIVGCSAENALTRFLHYRLGFLFGKRARTRQLLDSSKIPNAVFAKPISAPEAVEAIAQEQYHFKNIGVRTLSITPLLKLYRTTLFENMK
ncbi:class I SAM-dependent methyltransferase [Patescibacteria group bacterium]|nr:class I SAM-dependent methyltransferase [Patescibacteria group bacterium]